MADTYDIQTFFGVTRVDKTAWDAPAGFNRGKVLKCPKCKQKFEAIRNHEK